MVRVGLLQSVQHTLSRYIASRRQEGREDGAGVVCESVHTEVMQGRRRYLCDAKGGGSGQGL